MFTAFYFQLKQKAILFLLKKWETKINYCWVLLKSTV